MKLAILLIYIFTHSINDNKISKNIIDQVNSEIQWQNGSKYLPVDVLKYYQKNKSIKSIESVYKNGTLISHKNYDELGRLTNSVEYKNGILFDFEINFYNELDCLIKCINNSSIEEYNYIEDTIVRLTYFPLADKYIPSKKINYELKESILKSTVYMTNKKDTLVNYYYLKETGQINQQLAIVNSDTLRNTTYRYDNNNKLIHTKFIDRFSTKYEAFEGIFSDNETKILYDSTGFIISKDRIEFKDGIKQTKSRYSYKTNIKKEDKVFIAKIKFFKDGEQYKELDLTFDDREQIVRKEYNQLTKNKKTLFEYKIIYR